MPKEKHSASLATFIKLPFSSKIFFLILRGRFTQVLLYITYDINSKTTRYTREFLSWDRIFSLTIVHCTFPTDVNSEDELSHLLEEVILLYTMK